MNDGCCLVTLHPRSRVGVPMSLTLYFLVSRFLNLEMKALDLQLLGNRLF